jgi:hypothetical protein
MPALSDQISAAQRWMQFLITTSTIVVSTGAFVWAMMVYALDEEYVQIEDFEEFRAEVKRDIQAVGGENRQALSAAVSNLQCDLMRSELDDLDVTILYKDDHGIPSGLDKVVREQKLRAFQSRSDCH